MIPAKCLVHIVNIYLNQQPLSIGQALFGSDDQNACLHRAVRN